MKHFIMLGMLTPFFAVSANAICLYGDEDCGEYRDPRTGTKYEWEKNIFGETEVKGRTRDGDRFKTTIEQDGDMKGRDAGGNSWTYNSSSKRYYNYGTGETCYGEGRNRRCF